MSNVDFDALKSTKHAGSTRGWKPKSGRNEIRVLPPTKAFVDPGLGGGGETIVRMDTKFRSHFLRLEGQDFHVFRCLRDYDQTCPACGFYWKHKDSPDVAVAKTAKKFNNSLRFLINILDLADPAKGVQVYESGPQVRNLILGIVGDPIYGNCMSPAADGRNFFVDLTPADQSPTKRNQYSVMPSPVQNSVLELLPEGWTDVLDNLENNVVSDKPLAEIQALVDQAMLQVGLTPTLPSGAVTTPPVAQPTAAPASAAPVAAAPAPAAPVAAAATPVASPPPAQAEEAAEGSPEHVKAALDKLFGDHA